jgi:hypothetical protein
MSQNEESGTALEMPAPAAERAAQFAAPDLYELSGDGVSVVYHPVFAGGVPSLTYQDPYRTLHFRGDQIRRVDVPDLGTLISVTLVQTVDMGSTTFSVLLPRVNLPNHTGTSIPISTEGVTATHRLSPVVGLNQGARDVYSFTRLTGTAGLVILPL